MEENLEPIKEKVKPLSPLPQFKPKKRTLGEVYVKLDGGITSINKLNIDEFEAFLKMMDLIAKEFHAKKKYFIQQQKKNGK